MRKAIVVVAALALGPLGTGSAAAHPPATHLHCMTNASGTTHAVARGVTLQAPDDPAFHNFHGNVHLGAFSGVFPHTITVDFSAPYSC